MIPKSISSKSATISGRSRDRILGFVCFVLIVGITAAVPLEAVTRNVDQGNAACNDSSGTPFCTVQAAINASSARDVIVIAAGSYIEQITINRNVTLHGAGSSLTPGACNGVTNLLGSPPITVVAGVKATVMGVTVKGGAFAAFGGGVSNAGTLSMLNAEVCQNSTASQGGGIYTSGSLILLNVDVYDNAQDIFGCEGGGLFVASGGTALITNSSFSNNRVTRGGGIAVASGGKLFLNRSTIESNFADDSSPSLLQGMGGGIYNAGFAVVDQSQVGGRAAEGNIVLNPNGQGGGIYNSGQLLVTRSSIISNVIDYLPGDLIGPAFGAGLYNTGLASLVSTTVSDNIFQPNLLSYGAGIYNNDTLSLSNVTITANSNGGAGISGGAGIFADAGTVTIRNSIVASQSAGQDCDGAITTDGFNMDSDATCNLVPVASGGTDQPGVANPGLLALADNGGPTLTHNLSEDSPAIDGGNPAGCLADLNGTGTANVPLISDQRGNIFADVIGVGGGPGSCDSGAVEFNLLTNGMMEDDDELDRIPDGWTGANLLPADHLLLRPRKAHAGLSFFRLKGKSSVTKQLTQGLDRTGSAGDQYTLRIFTNGTNVSGSPKVRLQLDDLQTIGIDEEFVLPLSTGTYAFTEQSLDVTSAFPGISGYDTVTVIIEAGSGGKLGIDDVSLVPHP